MITTVVLTLFELYWLYRNYRFIYDSFIWIRHGWNMVTGYARMRSVSDEFVLVNPSSNDSVIKTKT